MRELVEVVPLAVLSLLTAVLLIHFVVTLFTASFDKRGGVRMPTEHLISVFIYLSLSRSAALFFLGVRCIAVCTYIHMQSI